MSENIVPAENSNQAEEVVLETADVTAAEESAESVEEVKSRLAKAEELANNYKVRAEKAERLAKQAKPAEARQEAPKNEMSTLDVVALVKANVPEDDISEVQEYAKFKNISVAEALKSSVVKSLLQEKAETRKSANATNVSNVKRGVAKVSTETLLSRAMKGELPESEEDMIALIKARRGLK